MAGVHPDIPGLADWRALARGGFATVWQAKQESLNRLVAVKVDQRTLDTESEQRRFLREAGAAGRMSGYPGIVTVHDAGILADNRPFLVMQLCTGGSLTAWVKGEERPSQARVREVGVRVADALAAAHAQGVLHRDVKPANILIDDYGTAGLADFGLAALPGHGLEYGDGIEAITPAYAPPEVFHRKTPTEFGDVYSLAATLYALLAGHPPRWPNPQAPTVAEMMERLGGPIERIPEVKPPFMDLLMSALADEPTDRPTAAQFRDRLRALQLTPLPQPPPRREPLPVVVASVTDDQPPEPESTEPSEPRRRRRAFVALVVAFVVVGLVSAFLALRSPDPTTGAPLQSTTNAVPTVPSAEPTSEEPTPEESTPEESTPEEETPDEVPAGFVDCSESFGADAYCAKENECYGAIGVYGVGLLAGVKADCDQTHIYQTFAAGRLGYAVVRQETLENDDLVKQLCTRGVANLMLRRRDQRDNWEIYALGPQDDGEEFFRCIFGRGNRGKPYKLVPPN